MIEDDLMKEIRTAKDAYARSFNYDLDAIVADLQALEKSGDWPVVRFSTPRPVGSETSHTRLDETTDEPGLARSGQIQDPPEEPQRRQAVGRRGDEASSHRVGHSPGLRRDHRALEDIDSPLRIEVGDAVGLAVDIPAMGLVAGEVGAAVATLDEGAGYKVEFRDHSGETYASCTLRADQLLLLHSRGQALRSGLHVV